MVKLYDCIITGGMKEQSVGEHGDWVSYDDYAVLQAENERLKAEVIDLCVAIADAYYETGEYKSAVDAALDIHAALIDAHKGE